MFGALVEAPDARARPTPAIPGGDQQEHDSDAEDQEWEKDDEVGHPAGLDHDTHPSDPGGLRARNTTASRPGRSGSGTSDPQRGVAEPLQRVVELRDRIAGPGQTAGPLRHGAEHELPMKPRR